jgi:hypothetical protein
MQSIYKMTINQLITYMFIVIVLIYIIQPTFMNTFEGFDDNTSAIISAYGYIDDNIAYGNDLSWSNKKNPYIDINQKGQRDAIIYQGHGIPLTHEDHPTTPVEESMYYFADYSCRPECCIFSPYSCSNGCVCWEFPEEKFPPTIQSLRTSPTS